MDENSPSSARQGHMTKKELKALRRMERLQQNQSGQDMTKWIIMAVGSILFLAAFAFLVISIKQSKNKPIEISSAGWIRGSESAKTTLVEFSDLQCPACRAAAPLIKQALVDFDGKIKLLFKHFPLTSVHANSMLAARAAEAAGAQDKFWEMHDWLNDNQDSWSSLQPVDAIKKMIEAAESLELDTDKFAEDIDSKALSDKINETQSEGINLGVNSTPTFYINNKKIEKNPQNYDEFKKLIQDSLK